MAIITTTKIVVTTIYDDFKHNVQTESSSIQLDHLPISYAKEILFETYKVVQKEHEEYMSHIPGINPAL